METKAASLIEKAVFLFRFFVDEETKWRYDKYVSKETKMRFLKGELDGQI
ncbi:hypothetical protein [Bacillus sp. AFS002410]|nr:hypothetical protein [Bacillus sp. AFS002410]